MKLMQPQAQPLHSGAADTARAATASGPPNAVGSGAPSRWARMGHDLAYLFSAFVLSVLGFVVLLPMFVLGIATAVVWIGVPILGFALLLASAFARESRQLLTRVTGRPQSASPYRHSASGPMRLVRSIADPYLWRELLHAVLVAFPLRLAIFVLGVTWVVTGIGSVTYAIWSPFVPGNSGLASLLLPIGAPQLSFDPYLADSLIHGVLGLLMVLVAPVVTGLLVAIDGAVSRIFLTGDNVPGHD